MTEEQDVEQTTETARETAVENLVAEGEAPTPEEEGAAEKPADQLTVLRQALEETQAREAEYLDGWQRARAELANARKRFQKEQEQAYSNAEAGILSRLLPIVDDFERALETLPRNLSGLTWIEGVILIYRKLQVLLEQAGVTPIEAAGEEFDPFAHQAVTHEPSETVAQGHVIAELQKGYRMGERVLRPSMVRVSAGRPLEPEPASEPPAEEEATEAESEQK